MKKIGIMTMHRIINYGSFLQAYGLKKTIESLGHKVEFVDYEYEDSIIKKSKKQSVVKKIINNKNIIKALKKRAKRKEFERRYQSEFLKILDVTEEKNIRPSLDTLVIGSDEVFNCLQDYPVGFSTELFGNHYDNTNVITYAACFGNTDYEKLKYYEKDKEVSQYLKQIKSISVRDENSLNTVEALIGEKVNQHLDPVLISDFSEELKDKKITLKDYIIVYAYPGRITKTEEKYIVNFAKKHKKKIVSIGFCYNFADYNLVVDPFEALAYFKEADYVITDTFHGTIFSVKMKTKFCTIIRDSNHNKLYDLLSRLNLTSRIACKIEDIEKLYNEEIDFKESHIKIKQERERSIDYLKKYL